MEQKALALEKRYQHQCAICMLIDSDNKDMKWHLYKEGIYGEEDAYVCDECLKMLKDIRKRANHKMDNPNHDTFKGFIPWFAKEVPGLVETFKKELA